MLAVLLTDAQSLLAECCVRSTYPRHPLLVVGARDLGVPPKGVPAPPPLYGGPLLYRYRPVKFPAGSYKRTRPPALPIQYRFRRAFAGYASRGSSESSLYARLAQARSLGAQGSVRIRTASRQRYQVCRPRSSSKPRTARG